MWVGSGIRSSAGPAFLASGAHCSGRFVKPAFLVGREPCRNGMIRASEDLDLFTEQPFQCCRTLCATEDIFAVSLHCPTPR